jgi:hypothetical protein
LIVGTVLLTLSALLVASFTTGCGQSGGGGSGGSGSGGGGSPANKAWGSPVLIETDNAGDARYPQIAVDSSGNALAVWAQSDGTRFNIWANRYL